MLRLMSLPRAPSSQERPERQPIGGAAESVTFGQDHPGNQVVLNATAGANSADLAADWIAKITNTGDCPAGYELTVRYQTLEGNLGKIDHIVVLMMENRSFDHMLGYLTIEQGRNDVEGLTANHANSVGGQSYPVHPASGTKLVKAQDPSHGSQSVAQQIAGGAMSG